MVTTVVAVLVLLLGVAVLGSGVAFIISERLWLRFEQMEFGSTMQLPVLGMRISRGVGRNLMRATFREHFRAAQIVMSIGAGAALIALGASLLAR